MTQEDLAYELGVDVTTVSRWERGETAPRPRIAKRLREMMGIVGDRGVRASDRIRQRPEPISLTDRDYRYVDVSDGHQSMFMLPRAEIVGVDSKRFWTPDQFTLEEMLGGVRGAMADGIHYVRAVTRDARLADNLRIAMTCELVEMDGSSYFMNKSMIIGSAEDEGLTHVLRDY